MASKLELKGVHVYEKVPGTAGHFRLTRINPALRLGCEAGHLYLQAGRVFEESGAEVKNPPSWFAEELAKCDPAALREVGYQPKPAAAPARK
jgi:hypothetical protein